MEYFPSVENYDMSTCVGKVQYLAHCDLEPIKLLIEQTKLSTQATIETFGESAVQFDETDEHYLASKYYDLQTVFAARVVPMSYESVLLITFSLFEESIKTWCRILGIEDDKKVKYDLFLKVKNEGELERAIRYIEQYTKMSGINKNPLWNKIRSIRTARNAIVHNGGRVDENKRKYLDEFMIGMREEDHSVYIDYETITDIYNTIIEFLDGIFSQGVDLESKVDYGRA
jgi:hypothetical protein